MESTQKPALRVQINHIDHTLIQPGSLDNSSLPRVPVIRIFGPSSLGKKTCLHIHQVYPYFFVEYTGKLNVDHVNHYVTKLTHSLDHAIALSFKRNPLTPNSRFVRAVILVKGVHFYGFHSSYSPFLKIMVADPACVNRAATILQSGAVMGTPFRVFESHLSYILQFMCDFGLYGCGWIDVSAALERDVSDGSDVGEVHFNPSPYFRQSRLPLEVDVIAPRILNRHRIAARNLHHKLEIPAPPLPPEPLVLSVRELWEDERARRRALGLNPSPEIPADPSDSSRAHGGNWVSESRWWEELRARIERERGDAGGAPPREPSDWQNWTMSTFESVEALWDESSRVCKPIRFYEVEQNPTKQASQENFNRVKERRDTPNELKEIDNGSDIEVDFSMISGQEISQMIEQEEAEWARLLGDDEHHVEEEEPDPYEEYGDETILNADSPVPEVHSQNITTSLDPFQQDYPSSSSPHGLEYSLASPPHFATARNPPVTPTRIPLKTSPDPPPSASQLSIDEADPCRQATDIVGSQREQSVEVSIQRALEEADDQPSKRRKLSFISQPDASHSSSSTSSPLLVPAPNSKRTLAKPIRVSYAFRSIKVLNLNSYTYAHAPPESLELLEALGDNIPNQIYRPPHYSRAWDIPERSQEYAGLLYHLQGGQGICGLEDWDVSSGLPDTLFRASDFDPAEVGGWEYASGPPSVKEVKVWIASQNDKLHANVQLCNSRSQIEGPTQANVYGLKNTLGTTTLDAPRERQAMALLSLEVFALTRGEQNPDPDTDEILAVFYTYKDFEGSNPQPGIVIMHDTQLDQRRLRDVQPEIVPSEFELINKVVDIVVDLDPDILVGWEVQRASWGYLNARGQQYGLDVADLISRAPTSRTAIADQWAMRHTSTFRVVGRHVLNLWRIMRSEQTLTSYTFENIAFHVLQQRIPRYAFSTLSEWHRSNVPAHSARILRYFSNRTGMVLKILEESDIITKTAEFARVFGVDFFSVISRGSQFKVESFMFRIAKPESFVLLSPSKQDVGKQNAAECMPLIMEPMSAFYSSPLLVLDFQSLYPSIMIAYNYCYSTCLGRINDFNGQNKLGVSDLHLPPGILETLQGHLHVAPNGIIYTKPEVRKGLLGRMLIELLDTRIMVKQAMKGIKNDKDLRRILDARQLSLKYICNVTYGYTSATFSGRMPAVEIADSIVQSGRETLEKAIMTINTTKKWGAEVVYGDTDSMFVYLPGKTKEQAFRIGNDIADTVTALNPSPVKLKFEKVYHPCVLMAKKRYVGFKYEHVDDKDPVFDAKGIETVRRDGVWAQRKMTENCLKILFRTQDLSQVKDYCCDSWSKLLDNKVSIQDFIFAKEVRMGTYSDKIPPPPGVAVAARRMLYDPSSEPQYGERVPYVITRGPPHSKLVDRAMDPLELLKNSHIHLDAMYYISNILIPPLERIFMLVGANVRKWFLDMPKTHYLESNFSPTVAMDTIGTPSRLNIEEHFHSSQCVICGGLASQGLCDECFFAPQQTMVNLSHRIKVNQKRLANAHRICATCTGSEPTEPIKCESLDCPWLFSRKRAENQGEFLVAVQELLDDLDYGIEMGTLYEDVSADEDERMWTAEDDSNYCPTTPDP